MILLDTNYGLMTSESEPDFVHHIALFAALLCACIVIGHLLEESRWINESITALAIGLGTGGVILLTSGGTSSHILEFKQEFFFIYLLPPIIFNAGFQVKKKRFFQNFTTITLFGAIGTLVSFAIISLGATRLFPKMGIYYLDMKDYFALGAIFSATDSVCTLQVLNQEETPLLYSLVFGEGVVNDATSVVLFNAITKFDLSDINTFTAFKFAGTFLSLFVLSTLLGVLVGLLCSFVIRTLYFGRNSTDREVSLMILMAYLSYVLAEVFGLSGILTVFFCGIVMSHYAWHNVTINSQVTTKHAFATMSFIAEISIFMYVGMDALDVEKWKFVSDSPRKSFGASGVLFGLIMAGRACFVFPISIMSNLTTKNIDNKIEFKQQITVWWAGLMRGAVSVALAYKKFTGSDEQHMEPANALLITTTIIIVFGLLTKPIINFLFPKSSQPSSPMSIMMPLIGHRLDVEGETGDDDVDETSLETTTNFKVMFSNPTNTIHYYWRKFDDAFMRPVFGGRGFISYVTGTRDVALT
ncbi:sodium/hydrogen exchanger 2-like isoform X2 [Bidens hawaiensis]|uniref:sodium/hydrogen exchanger 2-like isoform X2 n=1 Tax=Bidens hawaiensis TaxID=980011 RepID=UPI0040493B7E